MSSPHASGHHSEGATLGSAIRAITGLNAARCYQCGKCSAGCPMATEMSLKPHEMVRLITLDQRERLLSNESPWLCLTCETCSARCPNQVEPARLIDAVREIAWRGGAAGAPRPVKAFHQAFLTQIRRHGRMFELGLILGYKGRTGQLFRDADAGPAMLSRGKLKLAPHNIKGVADVRRLMDACGAEEVQP